MGADEKQKICVECRALVPNDAETCPECGYPFDDNLTTRCRSCNSIIVPDVENCPVCGQAQAVPQPENVATSVDTMQPVEPESHISVATESVNVANELALDSKDEPVVAVSKTQSVVSEEIQELAATQNRYVEIENMAKQMRESNNQLIKSISEYQQENRQTLQQSVDAIKAVVESIKSVIEASAPKESRDAEMIEMLADLKAAIADVGVQNSTSANMIVGAVNSSAAKIPEQPVIEMPSSVKWLDYMFIAIIVALIFSMGNLLIMAYVARLIMNSME